MKSTALALAALFGVLGTPAFADTLVLAPATAYSDASLVGGSAETNRYATTNDFGPNHISVSDFGVSGFVRIDNILSGRPNSINVTVVNANGVFINGVQRPTEIFEDGSTYVTYFGEVVGPKNAPAPTDPILMDMRATLGARTPDGAGQAYAVMSVQGNGLYGPDGTLGGTWNWEAVANYYGNVWTALNPNPTMQVMVDQPFEITMGTHTHAAAFNGVTTGTNFPVSDAIAWADPYFYIDPSVPNANLYSVVLSPGAGNSPVAGVPEPSTWAMMLIGLAGLGFAGRRRAQKSAAAVANA